MDGSFLLTVPGESAFFHTQANELYCHKAKIIIAASFLAGGIAALGYGLNALVEQLANLSVKIEGDLDPVKLKVWEKVSFDLDKTALKRNAIITISGLFTTALSAGLLLGMTSCPRRN